MHFKAEAHFWKSSLYTFLIYMFLSTASLILHVVVCMPALKIPFGPWNTVVSGKWGEHELELCRNPERVLALFVYDKKEEKISGALVFLKRILLVEGDASKFVSAQKRETMLVQRVSREQQFNYVVMGSTPGYVSYKEEDFSKEVRKQYEELEGIAKIGLSALRDLEIKARDFSDAREEEVEALLGDPMLLLALGAGGGPGERALKALIGLDSSKKPLEISTDSLKSVLVVGGEKGKRLHALHVLCEAALTNGVSCIVFDSSSSFSGLSQPNPDSSKFDSFKMRAPLSFVFREFQLGKGLFIDLGVLEPGYVLSALGINGDAALPIKKVFQKKTSSPADLLNELSLLKESRETSQYLISKSARVLKVLQKAFPGLFAKNASPDLAMPWRESGLGKVIYVDSKGFPKEIAWLAAFSVLKGLQPQQAKGINTFLVFEQSADAIPPEIIDFLSRAAGMQYGIGFAVHAENEIDFSLKEFSLKLSLLEKEAVVSEAGEKQKRVLLRPAYSACTEPKA
jgi:hypothetical protein